MLKNLLCCLFLCFAHLLAAQLLVQDASKIVAPLDSPSTNLQEYLVQLAWLNSPDGHIALQEVLNAKDRAKNTQIEWLRDIQATFNLNEANLRSSNSGDSDSTGGGSDNIFFPRYNFGINISPYNIISQKGKNKISKRDIAIAEEKVLAKKMAIRAETLARYAEFQMANNVLLSRRQVEQETKSTFVLIEQQYRTDEKTFEDYSTASTTFYQAQEARIRSENEVLQAQIRLEEAIGLLWAQVQHPAKK
jgi:outer membrane protein TolC